MHEGERVFGPRALMEGGFVAIASGKRKGTGSSRETAAQCERWSGVRLVFAASFAPIHERNNINLGQLMGGLDMIRRLQDGDRTSWPAHCDIGENRQGLDSRKAFRRSKRRPSTEAS